MKTGRLVADRLRRVLHATPFGEPNVAGRNDALPMKLRGRLNQSEQLLWCADYRALEQHCPLVVGALDGNPGAEDVCIDLTIELSNGNLDAVCLEGRPLASLFTTLNRPDEAVQAARLEGAPAGPSTAQLASLLDRLFNGSHAQR